MARSNIGLSHLTQVISNVSLMTRTWSLCRPNASKLEVFTVPTSRMALSQAVDGFLDALPRTTVLDRINNTLAGSTFWHARITTKLVRVCTLPG